MFVGPERENAMPEMTITLRINPQTGKKDLVITLQSDSDSLPHEHEQQHRQLVDKLLEGGMVKASELGQIVVEREEEAGEPSAPASNPGEEERRSQSQGE